jgi:hypothetical protein
MVMLSSFLFSDRPLADTGPLRPTRYDLEASAASAPIGIGEPDGELCCLSRLIWVRFIKLFRR